MTLLLSGGLDNKKKRPMFPLFSFVLVICALLFIVFRFTLFRKQKSSQTNEMKLKQTNPITTIPTTIHFVYGLWDDDPKLPPHYRHTQLMWEYQGWKVRNWGRRDVLDLLEIYPRWKRLYDSVPRKIQKADIARLVIVYDQGGFYMDCDCVPDHKSFLRYFEEKLSTKESVFFIEMVTDSKWTRETAQRFPLRQGKHENPERIGNFAFGATRRHHTIKAILDTVETRCQRVLSQVYTSWPVPLLTDLFPVIIPTQKKKTLSDYGVLYTTGPDAVTDTIQPLRHAIADAQSDVLFVLHHNHFLRHLCAGQWRDHSS